MGKKAVFLTCVFCLHANPFPPAPLRAQPDADSGKSAPSSNPDAAPSLKPPSDQVVGNYVYARPALLTSVLRQPGDLKDFWTTTFQRKNTFGIAAMAASTAFLIAADQSLFDEAWRWGDRMRLTHSGVQRTIVKTRIPWADYTVRLNGPHDLGTGLYFLGDGITHFSVAGGFLAYGLAKGDNRALQTSSQLVEAIFANGIVVQILKHVTGRENPNTLTRPGGRWRFFPNQRDYAKHVNKYDAYPSGHLATAMVTVTVISSNYPESKWVCPVGYTLMGALSFQMVNNGVHWVSDYPLALYMGWAFAKIAVDKGRVRRSESASRTFEITPAPVGGGPGIKANARFGGKAGG